LTFFQRIKTPFSESPADEQARLQPRMRLVGELLQERREDLGLDLDEIGAMLRIKPAYLAALEQGHTHDLPGPTYAIGFVRAYADFLGLEAEAVIARFKAEAAGVTARPDLALPVPLGERSLPGGALVLVALIMALCGYGIWYYLSTEERNRPERVAAVPASLQKTPVPVVLPSAPAALPGGADSNAQAPTQPSLYGAAASSPAASAPALPAAGSLPSPQPFPAQGAAPQAASDANLAPGALITTMPRNAAPNSPPSAAPAPQDAQHAAPPTATPSPPTAQQTAKVTASTPASPPSSAAAPATGGKITIKAVADCWIQVRAADQSIVFSRVLKSGETYTVPQRSGLSLRTGNAGALEIAVDGKSVPSIGGIGSLRRDVVLEPTELAAGTAVHG
jgi:cytoskeleton protein RodZ